MALAEIDIFTSNIIWLRKYYGISRKRMAELLNIGVRSLRQIEQGKLPPRLKVDVLLAVQKHFGISPALLLQKPFNDGEAFPLRK